MHVKVAVAMNCPNKERVRQPTLKTSIEHIPKDKTNIAFQKKFLNSHCAVWVF